MEQGLNPQWKLDTLNAALKGGQKIRLFTANGMEVNAPGYESGGKAVQCYAVLDGDTAVISFDPVIWPQSSITARYAEISGIATFDFGKEITSVNDSFTLTPPEATAKSGLIRWA
jgi:hypothetical protein